MDLKEFREFGYAAIDFLADYFENIRERFDVKFTTIYEWNLCFDCFTT